MRRSLLYAALAVFAISCSSGTDVPRGIMPVSDMKVVMYDMMCAQELAYMTSPKDTNAATHRTFELYQQVFSIHKITKDDFFRSFHYYEANPDKIAVLYDSLTAYSDRKKRDLYMKLR